MADLDQLDDLYSAGAGELRTGFDPGEKVKGTVSAITRNTVFIDVNAKSEGIVERSELEQDGELQVSEGDQVEAYFEGYIDGEFRFTIRMQAHDADDEALHQAHSAQIPLEGRVVSERKGGFEVQVGGKSGFCPFSQIDLFSAKDAEVYLNQSFTFLILEYDGDNLVLSRRALLEREQEAKKEDLQGSLVVDDVVKGKVVKVLDFGAFVDLDGAQGLIPASELSWDRSLPPSDVVYEGQDVEVRVIKIDWSRDRITLSLKQALGDPWEDVEDRFHVTACYHGKVVRTMPFGAFVQIEPGIEGLVHISKLGAGKRLSHASEVLDEGQEIDVYIESIDPERQRIGLSLENPQIGRTMDVGEGEALTVGAEMAGKVEEIKQYGVFVKLTPTQTGLLHVSEIEFEGNVNKGKEMYKRFPPGSELTVLIKRIEGKRISLGLPQKSGDQDDFREHLSEEGEGGDLGSLGSLLDGLNL